MGGSRWTFLCVSECGWTGAWGWVEIFMGGWVGWKYILGGCRWMNIFLCVREGGWG